MKTKIIVISILLLIVFGCVNKEQKEQFNIYIAELNFTDYPISIWVNDKLIFEGKFKKEKETLNPNYMFIKKSIKQDSTLFRISTAYKDTTFYYKTDTIRSLYIWIPYEGFNYFEIKDNNTPLKPGELGLD